MRFFLVFLLFFVACNQKKDHAQTLESLSVDTSDGTVTISVPEVADAASPTFREEFMQLLNEHRIDSGLQPLLHVEDLGEISQTHSENMAARTVAFGHTGFSARCSQARAVMDGGNLCAENVAMGQKTPQAAFNSWMNSFNHRANLESGRHTHTGFGYQKDSAGTWYWTQIFLELQ